MPTFSKQKKKNKVEPQRTLADTGSVDAPSPTRPSSASVDLPNAPSRPTSAASANVDVPNAPSRPTSAASANVDVPNAPSRPTSAASANVDVPNAPSRPTSVASADVDVPNAPSRPTSTASADIDAPDASSKKPASTASADVAVDLPAKKPAGKGNDDLARHMTSQQTGTDLKNALAKINASDNATVNSLKTSPVTVKVMDASGKPIEIKVTSAASLQQLHGMQVVTGEQALGLKPVGSQFGKSSQTYITITEVSPGKIHSQLHKQETGALEKVRLVNATTVGSR